MHAQDLSAKHKAELLAAAGFPPELAREHPWLPGLLAAYAFLEKSLALDIAAAGRVPACGPGCAHCCKELIPVTPPEIMGLRLWLRHHPRAGKPRTADGAIICPMLAGDRCLAYPVRPIACRRFVVFGRPCLPGEGPLRERPEDVLAPSRHALLHALRFTLPWYREAASLSGEAGMEFFGARTTFMHHLNFSAGFMG